MESVSEDYFDIDILKFTNKEYRKSARTVGEILGNTEPRITDDYIFWRIRELVKLGKISFKGKLGIMREMEICITNDGLKYLSNDKEAMEFWNERKKSDERKLLSYPNCLSNFLWHWDTYFPIFSFTEIHHYGF